MAVKLFVGGLSFSTSNERLREVFAATGSVESTIFAARVGEPVGYGVPTDTVDRALRGAHRPVSTGACAS